jgi:transketolase
MRNAFAKEITALASENERIILLSGDIGNQLFDNYKARFPERFFNCGVAEANMISMAAGMALCGMRPVAYTITPFITTRCLEQIRVDLCYHNVPVILVGTGSGLSYASLGSTHHSCEDIALLRVLPHMTVICPGDAWEVRHAVRTALKQEGPVYIRIGKKGEPLVHEQNTDNTSTPEFVIGKGIIVRPGDDVCLLSTGNMLPVVIQASEELEQKSVSTQVISFHTVKPLDETLLTEVFSKFAVVVTIEEHSLLGGFGSSVAEWLADQLSQEDHHKYKTHLCRIGTADTFLHEAGEQDHAREYFGLTSHAIAKKTWQVYSNSLP